jgi:hypothetical protein
MTIQLRPDQEQAIQKALAEGCIGSIDEFIDAAIATLPLDKDRDESGREAAVRRMEEFGDKYRLSLGEPITRRLMNNRES